MSTNMTDLCRVDVPNSQNPGYHQVDMDKSGYAHHQRQENGFHPAFTNLKEGPNHMTNTQIQPYQETFNHQNQGVLIGYDKLTSLGVSTLIPGTYHAYKNGFDIGEQKPEENSKLLQQQHCLTVSKEEKLNIGKSLKLLTF